MKIFGLGINKTGTTTLGVCLRTLGYRHKSCNLEMTRQAMRGEMEPVFHFADQYDSFEDWPWPLIYRQLDAHYPGSKFILTTRKNSEVWFRSLQKHAERTGPTEYRELIYGYAMPHEHEAEHIAFYQRHNQEVRDYFRGRENDFLEVCWETDAGWDALCRFLGHDIPDVPFPHANKSPNEAVQYLIRVRNKVQSLIDG